MGAATVITDVGGASARPALHTAKQTIVPIPRPRPGTAPVVVEEPQPTSPSACQKRLGPDLAVVEPLPTITGPNGCGADDAVRLSTVITRDKTRVALTPPATLRCALAEAIVHWVRDDLVAAVSAHGPALTGIANYASYECRGRNRVAGAKLSEHGRANALDVRGFSLAGGKMLAITETTTAKGLREAVRKSACARFPTVLGPGSDGYHENHMHIDLIERRSSYRICQWDVRDPEDVAAPVPRERPSEAPPRPDRNARARAR